MTRIAAIFLFATLSTAGCCPQHVPELEVHRQLDAQAAAWNRGDIDGFMDAYWRDPRLSFSSGGQTTLGWEQTRQRFRTRYPDAAAMGNLRFDYEEIRRAGRGAVLVRGRWRLDRAAGPVGGNFSVLFERIAGRWLITHDHTSLGPPATTQPRPDAIESIPAQ